MTDAPREGFAVRPTLDEVRALSGGGQVPITHEFIADCDTPISVFLKLRDSGPAFLLESAEEGQRLGRYSMIGVRPQAIIEGRGDSLTMRDGAGRVTSLDSADPFGAVEDAVASIGMRAPADPVAFWGGAAFAWMVWS